jgi:beta-lactamase regulating signal transducer with metallopeptidase domain
VETLLEVGLSNAAAALLLALLAAGIGLVCRRPALAHALWLLVLLKLVTPPLWRVPVPWPARGEQAAAVPVEAPAEVAAVEELPPPLAVEPAEAPADEDVIPAAEEEAKAGPALEEETLTPVPKAPADAPVAADVPWAWVGGGVWLAGSLAWFALAGFRLWRFARGLKHARPAPAALQRRADELARRLGLRRAPAVWLVPGRMTPMLWAVGAAPRLLLPAALMKQVSVAGRDTLLLHELAHLRRGDHRVRLLECLVLGLYWWHPAAWFACRELREAEEQCCDAWVVAMLPGAGRTYAAALLDTLDFLCSARPAVPVLASGIGQVADLKRRLTMIMRGDTPRALTWPAWLAVCGLGLALLPLLPAWVQAQERPKPREEETRDARRARDAEAELERAKAELDRAAADLAKRRAELERAKIELRKRAEEARRGARAEVARARAGAGETIVIRIELVGANPDKVKEIVAKLEKALPGDKRHVVVLRGPGAGHGEGRGVGAGAGPGRIIVRPGGPEVGRQPDARFAPGRPGGLPGGREMVPGGPRGGVDRRIEGLERKLEQLLRELEALRREMRRGGADPRPGPRGGSGGGGGGFGGRTPDPQPKPEPRPKQP